jgi:hypothetical protein
MDKVKKPVDSKCYIPTSEPFRIYKNSVLTRLLYFVLCYTLYSVLEVTGSSEILVPSYETTCHHIPEDNDLNLFVIVFFEINYFTTILFRHVFIKGFCTVRLLCKNL